MARPNVNLHNRLTALQQATGPIEETEINPSAVGITRAADLITCCTALALLEKSPAYAEQIRSFTSHPNPAIAHVAASQLRLLDQQP
jgi:hypothetical protein